MDEWKFAGGDAVADACMASHVRRVATAVGLPSGVDLNLSGIPLSNGVDVLDARRSDVDLDLAHQSDLAEAPLDSSPDPGPSTSDGPSTRRRALQSRPWTIGSTKIPPSNRRDRTLASAGL